MKVLLKNRLICTLLVLNLVVAGFYAARWGVGTYEGWRMRVSRVERDAAAQEKNGFMSKSTTFEFAALQEKADKSHRLSNSEMADLVRLGSMKAIHPDVQAPMNELYAFFVLRQVNGLSSEQAGILVPFVRRCLTDQPRDSYDSIAEMASGAVRKFKLVELLPELTSLASSNRLSSKVAKENLEKLRSILAGAEDHSGGKLVGS
jgi:hypothetical protein